MGLKKIFAVAAICLALLPDCGARAGASSEGAVAFGSDGAWRAATGQRRVNRRRAKRRMSKPTKDETARESVWGGAHVRLAFKEGRANVLFDCAHGEIAEPLSLDSEGRFDLRGTLVRRQAGHVVLGEKPDSQPARYSGKVVGDEMSLTVTLADSRETFDTFTLTRGSPGRLWKCY